LKNAKEKKPTQFHRHHNAYARAGNIIKQAGLAAIDGYEGLRKRLARSRRIHSEQTVLQVGDERQ